MRYAGFILTEIPKSRMSLRSSGLRLLNGIANPIGGNATMLEHSLGNTASNFTSWTSDYATALKFATNGGTANGAILTNTFAPGVAVPVAPNIEKLMMESELLVTGPTSGAAVTRIPQP
jgi:hypothetical protein